MEMKSKTPNEFETYHDKLQRWNIQDFQELLKTEAGSDKDLEEAVKESLKPQSKDEVEKDV